MSHRLWHCKALGTQTHRDPAQERRNVLVTLGYDASIILIDSLLFFSRDDIESLAYTLLPAPSQPALAAPHTTLFGNNKRVREETR